MTEIQCRHLDKVANYLDCVTYVPEHAHGNAGHSDSEPGVIISFTESDVKVLYSRSRTVQSTRPEDLVWG